jgi:hypothetical protein
VATLFGVGLISLKVVDRRANRLPSLLVRADSIYLVSGNLQRLKGNHHLVIFHKIPDQHENLLRHCRFLLNCFLVMLLLICNRVNPSDRR